MKPLLLGTNIETNEKRTFSLAQFHDENFQLLLEVSNSIYFNCI